jgi:hypothetical protein
LIVAASGIGEGEGRVEGFYLAIGPYEESFVLMGIWGLNSEAL